MGVKASGSISTLQSQTGDYTVAYSFLVTGAISAPTSQSVVTNGNPCDPLATPTTVLDLPGTWSPTVIKRQSAWLLQGTTPSAALLDLVKKSAKGYKGYKQPKAYLVFAGNQTLVGAYTSD
eukprot:TRINITY_DN44982_c0_g1_i1.p1 TRINITY_DN44982_c0_g1~~TRINITY_DN44982_c0_g1_i1.p1  ORF type:complete len:121 (+),score=6.43 TRINITY_DN44982_c0_g1_i1:132-494(+)